MLVRPCAVCSQVRALLIDGLKMQHQVRYVPWSKRIEVGPSAFPKPVWTHGTTTSRYDGPSSRRCPLQRPSKLRSTLRMHAPLRGHGSGGVIGDAMGGADARVRACSFRNPSYGATVLSVIRYRNGHRPPDCGGVGTGGCKRIKA